MSHLYVFNDDREQPGGRLTNRPAGLFVFTYGSLRPGADLDDLMPGEHVGIGYLPGKLYRHRDARFPVLVEWGSIEERQHAHNMQTLVTGDLFRIHDADLRQLDFITDMEVGAGYDVRLRKAVTADTGDVVTAIVYTWPERRGVGPLIVSGDYLSTEGLRITNELPLNAGYVDRR
jgi:gamma-glutamylcyclotransferase (GGCT)/AIG2-like uncharacterized protein YtfP